MTPVVGLPVSVPVKPAGVVATAVTDATDPLSAGAALGVTVVPAPALTLVAG